jgi:hypothetical protein
MHQEVDSFVMNEDDTLYLYYGDSTLLFSDEGLWMKGQEW